MSAASSYKHASVPQYRTVEYHDGRVVRVQETRRRQQSKEPASSPVNHGHTRYTGTSDHLETTVPALLEGQGASYSQRTTSRTRSTDHRHVTAKPRAKPVLVQANASTTKVRKSKVKVISAPRTSALPTPPPTPRMERLATPELSDLDDSPFCDCCESTDVVRYCASCGTKLDRC